MKFDCIRKYSNSAAAIMSLCYKHMKVAQLIYFYLLIPTVAIPQYRTASTNRTNDIVTTGVYNTKWFDGSILGQIIEIDYQKNNSFTYGITESIYGNRPVDNIKRSRERLSSHLTLYDCLN